MFSTDPEFPLPPSEVGPCYGVVVQCLPGWSREYGYHSPNDDLNWPATAPDGSGWFTLCDARIIDVDLANLCRQPVVFPYRASWWPETDDRFRELLLVPSYSKYEAGVVHQFLKHWGIYEITLPHGWCVDAIDGLAWIIALGQGIGFNRKVRLKTYAYPTPPTHIQPLKDPLVHYIEPASSRYGRKTIP